jgi:hypothetical protein
MSEKPILFSAPMAASGSQYGRKAGERIAKTVTTVKKPTS